MDLEDKQMLTLYHTCDHCGKRLDEMQDYIDIELSDFGTIKADLCAGCFEKINEIIKDFVKNKMVGGKNEYCL